MQSCDSIDCISSVKTNGTWKEYLGICTHVLSTISYDCDEIKFATHGDYLVKVPDSNDFNVDDTIYIYILKKTIQKSAY